MTAELPGFARPGPLRERLSGLVLAGAKTATFDLYDSARFDDPMPSVGAEWTMHDSHGRPLAVLSTTDVSTHRMADVSFVMANEEGESFVSAAHWRQAHERYWGDYVGEVRQLTGNPEWSLTDDTLVLMERFTLKTRLPAADEGRYPVLELSLGSEEDADWAAAEMYDLDTIGIEEVSKSEGLIKLRAGFASDDAAVAAEAAIWASHPQWRPRFEVIIGDDWLDTWREHFTPMRAGHIVVVPDWDNAVSTREDMRADDIELRLDPKRAWGTGAHPSTRLVLNVLQDHPEICRGQRVLDVGCGSGVLTIGALLLGAAHGHGIDVERSAIPVTIENAQRNHVGTRCTASFTPLDQVTDAYPTVLANILAPVLIDLAPLLQRVSSHTIVLAGLIASQLDRVIAAFDQCHVMEITSEDDWRGVLLRKRS